MKHQAWDDGAIADSFAQVFGEGVRSVIAQKTTKTYCGRRVSMDQISNGHATCAACLAELGQREEGRLVLEGYAKATQAFGFDYANSLTKAELIAAREL